MKLLMLGDVCPTKVNSDLFKAKDITALFGDTPELFKEKDHVFVNLECALTESDSPIEKFGPNLKAPEETAEVLASLGVDICGLSNNHVLDFGMPGIRDTFAALERAGISPTGFGEDLADSRRDLVLEKEGEKVAIIAVCEHEYSYALESRPGSRPFDPFETVEDVRRAKEKADRVIVCYHGGKEYCRYPSPRLLSACRAMVRAGADLVLCQHSHCIGCYESYLGGHILYGQGNFHFCSKNSFEGWHSCLAVDYDTAENRVSFTPIVSDGRCIDLARGETREKHMAEFEARNAELASGEWKKGWREFCQSVRPAYFGVVERACTPEHGEGGEQFFAHYLDCEAHTDVWRELFKTKHHTNTLE